MPLPPAYLAKKLTEALPTTDGGVLRTIGDAITYMTALPKTREMKNAWQHACKLILRREPVGAITRQMSLALLPRSTSVTSVLTRRRRHEDKDHFQYRHHRSCKDKGTMLKITRIALPKEQLQKLTADERSLFLLLGYASNQINALWKLVIVATNEGTKNPVEEKVAAAQG